ncbi:MAG: hypothetical protein CXZ00_13830 [Acidobacteria bacterium]|nr:MAG: hypothetical protein CXZ00_13830 [Acidobacteriota bacterium]
MSQKKKNLVCTCILILGLMLATGRLFANPESQAHPAADAASPHAAGAEKAPGHDLGEVSNHAEQGHSEGVATEEEEEEENAQFKYSSIVQAVAAKTGFSKEAVYWGFLCVNFAILAGALGWVIRKALPRGFAPRTEEIQKGFEDARKASAEASARLSEIEGRLAKLDVEITEIRTAAEADFAAEEQRIKAAAEQDAMNVIASAEQEISEAVRAAQRELKCYVADLAVGLAEKKIKVDEVTDQALVHGFAAQLGKDGQ